VGSSHLGGETLLLLNKQERTDSSSGAKSAVPLVADAVLPTVRAKAPEQVLNKSPQFMVAPPG
jgi:hypothetical protein